MRSALLHRPPPDPPLDAWFDPSLRPAGRGPRPQVCPPQAARSRPWTRLLRDWLTAGWPGQPARRRAAPEHGDGQPLEKVRQEFIDAVDSLPAAACEDLLDRIHFARSLRELWHLRAEVFRLVALHRSQAEADTRLSWLNRHFPTRSPRSGFGPLNAISSKDMWP